MIPAVPSDDGCAKLTVMGVRRREKRGEESGQSCHPAASSRVRGIDGGVEIGWPWQQVLSCLTERMQGQVPGYFDDHLVESETGDHRTQDQHGVRGLQGTRSGWWGTAVSSLLLSVHQDDDVSSRPLPPAVTDTAPDDPQMIGC